MRGLLISLLCLVALLSAALAGLTVSDEDREEEEEGVPILKHSPTNSLLPQTPRHYTALVAAPDGTIYLVEINSRKVLWSFASGSPIYSSYQALRNHEGDNHNASGLSDNFFIDCGDDWELYMHGSGFKKMKLPLSAEEFIRRTPYVSAAGGVMLGSKRTTVFLVDAKSGRVVYTFKSANIPSSGDQSAEESPILPSKDAEEWLESSDLDFEAVEQPLYITRTDYVLKYSSLKTGKVLWYLMFADIEGSFQCQAIENFFGGVSSKGGEFDPQNLDNIGLPLHCQTRPLVYRIRDRSSVESLFVPDRLPNSCPGGRMFSLPGGEVLSLPNFNPDTLPNSNRGGAALSLPAASPNAPGLNAPLEPLDRLPRTHQNNEGKRVLALPSPETEDSRVLDLHGLSTDKINFSIFPEIWARSRVWPFILFFAVLLSVAAFLFQLIRLAVRKQHELNKQAEDYKVQAVVSKRKKARKSGINRNNAGTGKWQKNVLRKNTVGYTSGPLHIERTERKLQHAFDNVDGVTEGRNIGKLFVSNKEIAKGSNGTIVLEGVYAGRPVAVKRLVQTHNDVALKEIQNLIASDHHPNIIRWYGVEFDQDFVYLSLERCTCSLYELISSYSHSYQDQIITKDQDLTSSIDCTVQSQWIMEKNKDLELWRANGHPSPQLLKLMRDVVYGLAHLHEIGIVHRDLKPQNVLILKERSFCAKLSDMGISKRLVGNMSSLTKSATGYGSSGWQAPEQLLHERQTRAVDLFSLGCVLFFCFTGGEHPFGNNLERDVNIVNNRKDLFLIENIPEALGLISCLLDPNPELRPKAVDILHHPLFWNSEMRLSFLRDASDRVELEDRENESELLKALESIGTVALGGKWDEKMDSAFINDIGRYRRYKFDSVRDLLRVIRNKLNHYRELPKEIRGILGQVPEGFDCYFSKRFPKLLIEVYKVLRRYCREEEFLRTYFKNHQI